MSPQLITVEGNIGVGKTTFLKRLEDNYNVNVLYEPVEEWLVYKDTVTNKSLFELYYEDKKRYAFTFQIMALQTRFEKLVDVCKNTTAKYVVCERSIFTDFNIFAKLMNKKGDMSDIELEVYKKCHSFMTCLCNINIHKYIYLKASPSTCLERIKQRGREGEDNIDIEFLISLHDCHETWLNEEVESENVIHVSTEHHIDYETIISQLNN